MYIHNICYDSNIFQEFWVNLLVFCKKIVLFFILLPLDKILRFFVLLFKKCLADAHTHTHTHTQTHTCTHTHAHTHTGKLCCLAGQLLLMNLSNRLYQ